MWTDPPRRIHRLGLTGWCGSSGSSRLRTSPTCIGQRSTSFPLPWGWTSDWQARAGPRYRSPAVNRCAKLRRRAVGAQILVSETTYSIVADILRDDIRLVSVGKRRLEGHDRPEEIYVVQHGEVPIEAQVEEDGVLA